MKIGPKYKICKRLGSNVFEKCQTQRYMLSEARREKNRKSTRRRTLSDFGRQLLEKQRVRYGYGISEKQLSRYVNTAMQNMNKFRMCLTPGFPRPFGLLQHLDGPTKQKTLKHSIRRSFWLLLEISSTFG